MGMRGTPGWYMPAMLPGWYMPAMLPGWYKGGYAGCIFHRVYKGSYAGCIPPCIYTRVGREAGIPPCTYSTIPPWVHPYIHPVPTVLVSGACSDARRGRMRLWALTLGLLWQRGAERPPVSQRCEKEYKPLRKVLPLSREQRCERLDRHRVTLE